MNIYIMSRGRAGKVNTLKWIPKSWLERTYLVVQEEDATNYALAYPQIKMTVVPERVTNYSQKVQFLIDGIPWEDSGKPTDPNKKALIMDDDLVFSKKVSPKSLKTITNKEELVPMFTTVENLLDSYALVGVHPRQQGNLAIPPYVVNGRIICIQGINRELIGKVKVDQFPILADVSLNLQLLARGLPNAIITTFFQDHGPCQAPGGCSIYRTPAMQREAVEYFAKTYPGYVKVVEKKPKVAKWMGETRYDYVAQWKKLYNDSVVKQVTNGH